MHHPQRRLEVFISDCEGPISKNDNAFEITAHFLPNGDRFFSLISRYDDAQADIVKRPGYRAGDTLKLITPFMKAYDVTNKKIEEYSSKNVILIRGAKEMLQRVKDVMPSFIVSTSYEQYMSSLCSLIGFPYENVYCTKLDLDKYPIIDSEVERLKRLEEEISTLPMIEMPRNATSIDQIPGRSRETIRRLDSIFWEEIPQMKVGRMLEEIKPIGGAEKAKAVKEIAKRVSCDLRDIMYVGDSITDVQIFQMVREDGGLTVSFNGNEYSVRNAEIAVLSENAVITSVLTDVFAKSGKDITIRLVKEWSYQALGKYCSDKNLIQEVSKVYPETLPKVELVTEKNMDRLIEESSNFRKTVRGEAIGRLG
ncbi:MAG: HAD hydrolase family protein [Candidatus Bathyarchaeota archaeon]